MGGHGSDAQRPALDTGLGFLNGGASDARPILTIRTTDQL